MEITTVKAINILTDKILDLIDQVESIKKIYKVTSVRVDFNFNTGNTSNILINESILSELPSKIIQLLEVEITRLETELNELLKNK